MYGSNVVVFPLTNLLKERIPLIFHNELLNSSKSAINTPRTYSEPNELSLNWFFIFHMPDASVNSIFEMNFWIHC